MCDMAHLCLLLFTQFTLCRYVPWHIYYIREKVWHDLFMCAMTYFHKRVGGHKFIQARLSRGTLRKALRHTATHCNTRKTLMYCKMLMHVRTVAHFTSRSKWTWIHPYSIEPWNTTETLPLEKMSTEYVYTCI